MAWRAGCVCSGLALCWTAPTRNLRVRRAGRRSPPPAPTSLHPARASCRRVIAPPTAAGALQQHSSRLPAPASSHTPTRSMRPLLAALLLLAAAAGVAAGSSSGWLDVTVPVRPGLPLFEQARGLPKNWLTRHAAISDGDVCNQSSFCLDAHTGTHVDAPLHFVDGSGAIESLDLDVLMGEALVVQVPEGSNITGEVVKGLKLPAGVKRVLFKTDNSAKRLMHATAFVSSYTSLDSTAAAYITEHTGVRLVGIDYLSIGCLADIVATHQVLFRKGVIAVEGLDLAGVEPGLYDQLCLPAKLAGSDGAPVRCLLRARPAQGGSRSAGDEL